MGAAASFVLPAVAVVVGSLANLFNPGSRPASAPSPPSQEERARLEQQRAEVARLQAELEQQRRAGVEQAAAQAEEFRRREAAVREREEQLEREREQQRQQEEEARNYPLQPYQEAANWQGSVNIGLVGNAGVGKSMLMNAIRHIARDHPEWAPVGVNETTMAPKMYAFPGEPRARLWDLPGAGTAAFPRETYIRNMGLRYFDAVINVCAGRFTETETMIQNELRSYNVPFFAVRNKVDLDIENNLDDNGISAQDTKRTIAADLRERGVIDPYLINAKKRAEHDFEKLERDVIAAIRANRRV